MTNLEARKLIYNQLEQMYSDLPNEIEDHIDDPAVVEAICQFLEEIVRGHEIVVMMLDSDTEMFAEIPEIRNAVVTLLNKTKNNHTKRLCLRFLESTLTAP